MATTRQKAFDPVTQGYYTVVIPFSAHGATQWHPRESRGPWSRITRGVFEYRSLALAWARQNLGTTKFTIKHIPGQKKARAPRRR